MQLYTPLKFKIKYDDSSIETERANVPSIWPIYIWLWLVFLLPPTLTNKLSHIADAVCDFKYNCSIYFVRQIHQSEYTK